MTVLENLIMAPMNLRNMPRQQAVDLAEALLAKVNLSDKRDACPRACPAASSSASRLPARWR